jgi:MoxR-like ATPase
VEPDTPATEPTDVVESTDGAAVATEAAETTDPAEATDIVEAGDADAAKAATEDAAEAAEAIGDAAPAVVAAAPADLESPDDIALADKMKAGREQILSELHKKIIGQNEIIEQVLQTLFVGGNSLIVGVPGLAKTLLIQTMAQVLDLKFARIQFTPDLMPSDITGTDIIQDDPETGGRRMVFAPGPVFTNILLADEINRTPPKTQSALLEAMQEHRVTVLGRTYDLKEPFFVFATQNPIELEGTYPLPEAQLDRFMFHIGIDYPDLDDEVDIVLNSTSAYKPQLERVLSADTILRLQDLVRRVPATRSVVRYAAQLSQRSRPGHPQAPDFVRDWVNWGAGPRASQYLILGAKARAIMHGRFAASVEDVKALAPSVLRHRILTNFNAEAEGMTSLDIVQRLLDEVQLEGNEA